MYTSISTNIHSMFLLNVQEIIDVNVKHSMWM